MTLFVAANSGGREVVWLVLGRVVQGWPQVVNVGMSRALNDGEWHGTVILRGRCSLGVIPHSNTAFSRRGLCMLLWWASGDDSVCAEGEQGGEHKIAGV